MSEHEPDFGPAGDGRRPRTWADEVRQHLEADPPDYRAAASAALTPTDPARQRREAVLDALERESPDPQRVANLIRDLERAAEREADVQPMATWANEPLPEPILWLAEAGPTAPLLSAGEVALLASPGGLGKSTITLGIAAAAAGAGQEAKVFGLGVRPGPVTLASYEDSPARLAHRMRWYAPREPLPPAEPDEIRAAMAWENVHPIPRLGALWQADEDGGSRPGPEWPRFWRTVGKTGAKLAVIDPASVALADVSTSETGPVRAFLGEVAAEAEENGCGVLIVAHDTKASRNLAAAGENPGAGAVAGSAAWYDAARGVAYLRSEADGLTLECLKSNHGPTGWGVRLKVRENPFRGPDPTPDRTFARPEDLAEWRASEAEATKKAKPRKTKYRHD